MSSSVLLCTDRDVFEPEWRPMLEQHGMSVRRAAPNQIGEALKPGGALIVDAASSAFDEDELLTTVGFSRALGAHAAVVMPKDERLSSVEDMLDEMCDGLVARGGSDSKRIAATLARRMDKERAKRFEFVTVAPQATQILAIMADGNAALLERPASPEDDKSEVLSIEMSEDALTATLKLASGKRIELNSKSVAQRFGQNGHGASNGAANGTMPIDGARLGARLRELRLEAGLTQAELARRTGIHRPNIARVEAGRHTPSLETLARLANAIGVPTTRVLSED